jgi:predicted Ser/Thr protein kinase
MTLSLGSKLGRFEITGVLGEGAMGTVYLAHDPQIDRPVAVKTLRRDLVGEDGSEIATRFLKEAKLAGRLQHPNIVTIYEAGTDQGVDYIAMEYVDGQPLNRLISDPDFSLSERVEVVRQAALALEHAHERGVLHRDIKPGNILITQDGRVKVADFGIGKLLGVASDLTRAGQMVGSPAYMSPEQIRGETLDGRSDFFSLGVVFYELLTGSRPFPGDTITTLVYQILHAEPRDPLKLRADLPASTREVFSRLLAKAPARRPASGREFLREVSAIEREIEALHLSTRPLGAPALAGAGGPPFAAGEETEAAVPAGAEAASRRISGLTYLFGVAALILAVAILVAIWRRTSQVSTGEQASAASSPPAAKAPAQAPEATSPMVASPQPESSWPPAPTAPPLPTRGPREAADATVGAPRPGGEARARRPSPSAQVARADPPASAPEPPEASVSSGPPPERTYRTRRFAKFSVSPDQARIYLDGRYVGIADDWDDHGGGKTLEMGREGGHRVRLELPGYRTLSLEVEVTPEARDDTVDIGDDLKSESKVPFTKLPKLDDRTVGPVEFVKVEPPDAVVSEGERTLGPASSFGPDSPLRLSGPLAHDLRVSAPGYRTRTFRILVTSNADREVARVKVDLKKE